MTTLPQPIDPANDLNARLGAVTVAEDTHGSLPPPSSAQSPPNAHNIHALTSHSTLYSPYSGDQGFYWSDEAQHALNNPFSPSPHSSNAPVYPYGGPPPDLMSQTAMIEDGLPSVGNLVTQQQGTRSDYQALQHYPQGPLNRLPPVPAGPPTPARSGIAYRPPHLQHQQAMQEHHHTDASPTSLYYGFHDGMQDYFWRGAPQGMHISGERIRDIHVRRPPTEAVVSDWQPAMYPMQSAPLHTADTRHQYHTPPPTYPPHQPYTGSPTHANFAPYTPATPSYRHSAPVQYGLRHHPQVYGLQTPFSPNLGQYHHLQKVHRRVEPHVPRSPLLEEFRLNRSGRKWELKEIFGYFVEFAGDQHGSRFIQNRIENCSTEDRQRIFDEILPNAFQLMIDVFGNYVIQKMFEHGDEPQKEALAQKMVNLVKRLSVQMYGCRVVQKAFEHVLLPQREQLVKELEPDILDCVKSANANHVIQRLITLNPPQFVLDAFVGHVFELAADPYGCRILQKTLESLELERKRGLLDELHQSTHELMKHQFGNYVVQSVIVHGPEEDRSTVIGQIKGQMVSMSCHKYASNVCEKALIYGELGERIELTDELIGIKQTGRSNVEMLLRDPFGNFALQTAFKNAEKHRQAEMIDIIEPLLDGIRHTPVGKRLIASIEDIREKTAAPPMPPPNSQQISQSSSTSATNSASVSVSGSSSTGVTSPDPRPFHLSRAARPKALSSTTTELVYDEPFEDLSQ